jgi:matrixin
MKRFRLLAATTALLLATAPASAFTLLGSKWPSGRMTYNVSIPGSSTSGTPWNLAFTQAAQHWTDHTAFTFTIAGSGSDPCNGFPGFGPEDRLNGAGFKSTVCGENFGSTTLAITLSWSSAGTTTETDIVFNSSIAWDIYTGPWRFSANDFKRVATHELGHSLGLGHEDSVPSVMSSFTGDVEQLQSDDLQGAAALYGSSGEPAPTPVPSLAPLVLNLEEPAGGEVKAGIANLRGWAVALNGVNRVELYIDGVFQGRLPLGGNRPDVQTAFPGYPGSLESGYSAAYAYSVLAAGSHTVLVRAYDNHSNITEKSATFDVVRFDNPFIANAGAVSLQGATVSHDGTSLFIDNLLADGKRYRATMRWQTATQSYEIVGVQRLTP